MKEVGAIILAAGKGTRMGAATVNKVTLTIKSKPLIQYAIDLLANIDITNIVVVVGHKKDSVIEILKHTSVIFSEQKEQLGTAHATLTGLQKLPKDTKHVYVLQGDDAMFFSKDILLSLYERHSESKSSLTFLTLSLNNPTGLGRIKRDKNGKVQQIIEEKDANDEEKMITEINPGCYLFSIDFLKKYLHKVEKSSQTNEYYLTSLIDIALQNQEKIETITLDNIPWRGVNTKEEFMQAENILIH